jgi:hypothetical protein
MNDEITTAAHEGQVYQLGQGYLFSMSGITWAYDRLLDIDGGYSKPFCTQSKEWRHIKEVPASKNMGTITPAPIELIDNGAYMFDFKDETCIGFYELSQEAFFDRHDGGKQIAKLSFCTNIRLMTVESK